MKNIYKGTCAHNNKMYYLFFKSNGQTNSQMTITISEEKIKLTVSLLFPKNLISGEEINKLKQKAKQLTKLMDVDRREGERCHYLLPDQSRGNDSDSFVKLNLDENSFLGAPVRALYTSDWGILEEGDLLFSESINEILPRISIKGEDELITCFKSTSTI